jgi:hypothetical protein
MKKLCLALIAVALCDPAPLHPQIELTDGEKYDRFEETWAAFLDYYGNLWIGREARSRGYSRERTAEYATGVTRGMRAAALDAEILFLSYIDPAGGGGFTGGNRDLLRSLEKEDAPLRRLTTTLGDAGLLKEEYDNLSRLVFVKTYLTYACKYLDLTAGGNGTTESLLNNVVNEISGWAGGSGKFRDDDRKDQT